MGGVVRETWTRCVKIRQILRNLLIKVEEKDVFMCRENQIEAMERLNSLEVTLPQIFVDGHYIGNAETVEKLNETGDLRQLLRPYKVMYAIYLLLLYVEIVEDFECVHARSAMEVKNLCIEMISLPNLLP